MSVVVATPRAPVFRFLAWASFLAFVPALTAVGLAFVFPRTPSRTFVAGSADEFAPASVTHFEAQNFFLVRLHDGRFLAFYDLDPFLQQRPRRDSSTRDACRLQWHPTGFEWTYGGREAVAGFDGGTLREPCFYSTYSPLGERLYGPSPANLDSFRIRVRNGYVEVNLSQRVCGEYVSGPGRRCNSHASP